MKIGIVSDTHLGYKRFEHDAFEQAKSAFIKAADICDVILSPGDIFDSRVPDMKTIICAIDIFLEVKKQGKKVFVIPGTHERRTKELPNPIDLLERAGLVINVHNKTETFELNGERITISGLGGVPEELATEALKHLTCKPVKNAINIFMFHQTIRELTPMAEETAMSIEDLPTDYDIYICGHYHKQREIPFKNKKIIIPGSTILTQLREEEQDDKGFLVYDTIKKEYMFIPIECRRLFYTKINVQNADHTQINNAIKEKLEYFRALAKQNNHKKIALKIIVEGTIKKEETAMIAITQTKEYSSDDFYIEIDDKTTAEDKQIKIDRLKELRNKSGENIVYDVLKYSAEQHKLDFDWRQMFDILAEGDETQINNFLQDLKNQTKK